VDLRQAERDKYIKELEKRSYSTTMRSATVVTRAGASLNLNFAPGVTVLSGGNGAGKSSVLAAIHDCLCGTSKPDMLAQAPKWIESIEIEGASAGETWTANWSASESGVGCPVAVVYVNAVAETESFLAMLRSDASAGDLFEGVDSAEFNADELALASFVLKRQYRAVSFKETSAFDEEDSPQALFEVTFADVTYSTMSMGRGELAALHLLWKLTRLDPGTVVLLEEPESHLSVTSQALLIDALIVLAVERDLTLVVSSHSPSFFYRLPDGHVTLVSSLPRARFDTSLPTATAARHLALPAARRLTVLVEDAVASDLLISVLGELDRNLLAQIDVGVLKTAESGIRSLLNNLKVARASRRLPVLGVLDGDQRGVGGDSRDLINYLPGGDAPEKLIREALIKWWSGDGENWNPTTPGGAGELTRALDQADGADHHDWLFEVSRQLGGVSRLVDATAGLLLQERSVREQAEQLVDWLRRSADGR
jgi:predicted ATPase